MFDRPMLRQDLAELQRERLERMSAERAVRRANRRRSGPVRDDRVLGAVYLTAGVLAMVMAAILLQELDHVLALL